MNELLKEWFDNAISDLDIVQEDFLSRVKDNATSLDWN